MKKILTILVGLVIMFSINSCYAQYDYVVDDDTYISDYYDYEVQSDIDFNIVITYGVPYYYRGSLSN